MPSTSSPSTPRRTSRGAGRYSRRPSPGWPRTTPPGPSPSSTSATRSVSTSPRYERRSRAAWRRHGGYAGPSDVRERDRSTGGSASLPRAPRARRQDRPHQVAVYRSVPAFGYEYRSTTAQGRLSLLRRSAPPGAQLGLRHRHPPRHCGTRSDLGDPAPNVGALAHHLRLGAADQVERHRDPRVGRDVRDRVVAGEELDAREPVVHDLQQARGLRDVAVDGVGDLLLRHVREVVGLAHHRADVRHLPHEPLERPGVPWIAGRQEPPRLLGEVDEDGARLEEREVGLAVDDRRDLAVWADGDELGLELLALADVDGVNGVGQAALLEHDGDLPAVRRRPGVEVDHAPGMVAPTSYVNPLASGGRAAYQGPHA